LEYVDLGRSIEAIYSTNTWSDVDSTSNPDEPTIDVTHSKDTKSQHIQDLLAEATGSISQGSQQNRQDEHPTATNNEADNDDDDDDQSDMEGSDMKQSIDKTVQLIFNLPQMEKLESGKLVVDKES
jgi:hypothetical protein